MKRFVLVLVVLAIAERAYSDQFDNVDAGTATVTCTSFNGDMAVVNGQGETVGPYSYTISNVHASGSGNMIVAGSYQGFCVELGKSINLNTPSTFTVYDASASPSMGVTSLNLTGSTLQNVFKLLQDYYVANGNSITPVAGKNADALSVAIWATMAGDTSINGSNPSMTVSFTTNNISGGSLQAPAQLANTWLSTLGTTSVYGGEVFAFSSSSGVQGFEIAAPVPEPGSVIGLTGIVLAGLALLIAGRVCRRRVTAG
jgi:hypothetical protein